MTSLDALLPYAKLYTWRDSGKPGAVSRPNSHFQRELRRACSFLDRYFLCNYYYYLIQWQCTNIMAKPQAVRILFHAHTTMIGVCWHTVTQADNAMAGEGMGSAIGQRTRGHCAPAICVSRSEPSQLLLLDSKTGFYALSNPFLMTFDPRQSLIKQYPRHCRPFEDVKRRASKLHCIS